MQFYTGYTEEELIPVIQHISAAHHTLLSSKYKSILNKFDTKGHKFCCSSILAISSTKLRYDLHSSSSSDVKAKATAVNLKSPKPQNTSQKITPKKLLSQPSRSS
jgi:hypothetical protein